MTALIIATALLTFIAMRFYANDENRLPSPSTKKGKEARIVIGAFWGVLVIALATNEITASESFINPWSTALIAGGLVGIVGYIVRNRGR